MADNIAVTAGSGTTVLADEVTDGTLGTGIVGFVKLMDGTLDGTTKLKIVAEDAAHSTGDTGIVTMAVRQDTAAALGGTDGDYMPLIVDSTGRLHIANADLATIAAAVSTEMQVDVVGALPAGANTIGGTTDEGPGWTTTFGVSGAAFTSADASTAAAVTDAPTAGQKLVITDIIFSVDTAMQVDFEIETAGTVFLTAHCAANTVYQITPRSKLKLPTADKKLMVDTSAAGNIAVTAFYYSEA